MADPRQQPVAAQTLADIWRKLGRLVARMIVEHAHCEVVISVQDGRVRNVRVNRSYLPDNLPEV